MLIQEFGYVCYGVRDLDAAVEFYRNVCQLEVSERTGDTVFLTGGERHHWVRLERAAEPGLIRLGYRAVDAAALDEIAARLDRLGVAYERPSTGRSDRVRNTLRFRAPDGLEFEIYEQMLSLPSSPAPERGLACLLHAVAFVADVSDSRDFYADALGLLVSDQIEEVVVFLRAANQYHHSLALARGQAGSPASLDHIAILVGDVEDVLRFRAHGQRMDALAGDVVKHVASSSVSVYLNLPAESIGVEYCNGHGKIADEHHHGRYLKAGPTTVNAWAGGFPMRAAQEAATAPVRAENGGTAAASLASAAEPELASARR